MIISDIFSSQWRLLRELFLVCTSKAFPESC